MKHLLYSILLTATITACHTTRVVTPLEPGELRVGAHAGGPMVDALGANLPAPSSSLYIAYGWNRNTSIYTGVNLSLLNYWMLHQDVGAVTRISGGGNEFGPQLMLNYGVHQFWSIMSDGHNTYPHLGLHAAWPTASGWQPYAGVNQWITPNNMNHAWWRPYGFMGLRKLSSQWEYGIEAKALTDMARDETQFGSWGLYLHVAYRLETFQR